MSESGKPIESIIKDIAKTEAGIELSDSGMDKEVTLTQGELSKLLRRAYTEGDRRSNSEAELHAQLFSQLMETLPDHIYFKDLQSRFICINTTLARQFDLSSPEEAIGKTDFDMFPSEAATAKFEDEQRIIREEEGHMSFEEVDLDPDKGIDIYKLTTKLPLRDDSNQICGTFGISRNITEQKEAQIELSKHQELLEAIIRILPCRIFVRDKDERFLVVNEEYMNRLGIHSKEQILGKRLSEVTTDSRIDRILEEDNAVIDTGKGVYNKLEFDQSIFGDKVWVLTSKIPLLNSAGEIEGIVGMTLDISEQKRAETRAKEASEALRQKNEQFETELLVARRLQEQMMAMGFESDKTYSKSSAKWRIDASYLYSPSHHLAGDFFFLLPISSSKIGILVCDVMGHGVKASLVTMLIRGLVLEIPDILSQPSAVLQHLNDKIMPLADDMEFPRFITAVYATIDLERGHVAIANAGHPRPLVRYADNDDFQLDDCSLVAIGPALGIIEGESFEEESFEFDRPTELYFFTDGIVEQLDPDGKEFGRKGLIDAIGESDGSSMSSRIESVEQALCQTSGAQSLSDDICMIAARLSPLETPLK